MPAEHHVDPKLLDTLALQVARSSTAAVDASHELLAHYGDTGDSPTQRALDTMIDQAADALRALADSLAELSGELTSSMVATPSPGTTVRPAGGDGSPERPRRTRGY